MRGVTLFHLRAQQEVAVVFVSANHQKPGVDYKVTYLGEEQEPLVVLDGLFDTNGLIEDAASKVFAPIAPYYPGVRAKAPLHLLKPHGPELVTLVRDVFGSDGLQLIEHNYSLVTKAPSELAPIQRLPHFDGFEPRLALLVYLRAAGQGGTAFYRQKATGFETVTEANFKAYEAQLRADVDADGLGDGYFMEGNGFERIGEVEAMPGRVAIYRGRTLHSGVIGNPGQLSDDPATGRLTLNTFFLLR